MMSDVDVRSTYTIKSQRCQKYFNTLWHLRITITAHTRGYYLHTSLLTQVLVFEQITYFNHKCNESSGKMKHKISIFTEDYCNFLASTKSV